MTQLEKLQQTFTDLGIKFTVTLDNGELILKPEREWYKDDKGNHCFKVTGDKLPYDTRVDTEQSTGHAEMCFYFYKGNLVTYEGYET